MGYDVHITRGDWWDQESAQILDEEWLGVVDRDPDLTLTGEVTATAPSGETIGYANPLLAIWNAHPDGGSVPFDFRKGRVVVEILTARSWRRCDRSQLL
jgi:hypothetical protein